MTCLWFTKISPHVMLCAEGIIPILQMRKQDQRLRDWRKSPPHRRVSSVPILYHFLWQSWQTTAQNQIQPPVPIKIYWNSLHLFMSCCLWLFGGCRKKQAKLSSCDTDHMSRKAWNIYALALYSKKKSANACRISLSTCLIWLLWEGFYVFVESVPGIMLFT